MSPEGDTADLESHFSKAIKGVRFADFCERLASAEGDAGQAALASERIEDELLQAAAADELTLCIRQGMGVPARPAGLNEPRDGAWRNPARGKPALLTNGLYAIEPRVAGELLTTDWATVRYVRAPHCTTHWFELESDALPFSFTSGPQTAYQRYELWVTDEEAERYAGTRQVEARPSPDDEVTDASTAATKMEHVEEGTPSETGPVTEFEPATAKHFPGLALAIAEHWELSIEDDDAVHRIYRMLMAVPGADPDSLVGGNYGRLNLSYVADQLDESDQGHCNLSRDRIRLILGIVMRAFEG